MKVKVLKPMIGWQAKIGDVIIIPEKIASALIEKGIVEPVGGKLDEEFALWGLGNMPAREKELIKFACNLFHGVIVDVQKNTSI